MLFLNIKLFFIIFDAVSCLASISAGQPSNPTGVLSYFSMLLLYIAPFEMNIFATDSLCSKS